jgi:hypothetical protein
LETGYFVKEYQSLANCFCVNCQKVIDFAAKASYINSERAKEMGASPFSFELNMLKMSISVHRAKTPVFEPK